MISKRLLNVLIVVGVLIIILGITGTIIISNVTLTIGTVVISNVNLRMIISGIEGLGWGCLIGGIGTLYKQKGVYK